MSKLTIDCSFFPRLAVINAVSSQEDKVNSLAESLYGLDQKLVKVSITRIRSQMNNELTINAVITLLASDYPMTVEQILRTANIPKLFDT